LSVIIPARADRRALYSAVLIGSSLGLLLGGAYLAGGQMRAADAHAKTQPVADAAAGGSSEAALRSEVSAISPGAQAVARRQDPAAPAPQRLAPQAPAANAHPPLLRASLTPAKPLHAQSGTRELDCLSQAVYYEARGESSEGQAAVAQVVLNRTRHAGYPKTVCGVVYQGCQFSFACDGSERAGKEAEAWRRARGVAARALSGLVVAQIGDATHFHVARLGNVWGQGLVRVAQIGAHTFYRLSGRAAPASEPADRPVYAEAKAVAARPGEGAGTNLILAAAVGPAPMAAVPARVEAASAPSQTPGAKPAVEKAVKADTSAASEPVTTAKAAS
jgi:spore germination cell wall hydrolase CwlJ-like protein